MLGSFFDGLVGPMNKSYCLYFYFLAILFFAGFVVSGLKCLSLMFSSKKMMNPKTFNCLMVTAHSLVFYLVNRIFFNMCKNSL